MKSLNKTSKRKQIRGAILQRLCERMIKKKTFLVWQINQIRLPEFSQVPRPVTAEKLLKEVLISSQHTNFRGGNVRSAKQA